MRIHNILKTAYPVLILGGLLIVFTHVAFAQIGNIGQLSAPSLDIIVHPNLPRAFETVSLEAKSYSANLNSLDMYWYSNEKIIDRGYGKKTASVTVGDIGSTTRISVIGKLNGVTVVEGSLVLRPSELIIATEADTTAPFWYRGRKLPAPRGNVRITAFPTLSGIYSSIDPARLLYTWQINGLESVELSAIGAQTYVLDLPKAPKAVTRVSVTASDPRGTYKAKSWVDVVAMDPHVALYSNRKESPARSAVSQKYSLLPGEKFGLIAQVYYFNKTSTLKYIWSSNQQIIPTNNANSALLTMPQASAQYNIVASVENEQNVFERATSRTILNIE